MDSLFPNIEPGMIYLTEGGSETEIMYKYGYDFPHFAMFELLKNPQALQEIRDMYCRYLDVCAEHNVGALFSGIDYRASPDWGEKLGYNLSELEEIQRSCIELLRDISKPYSGQVPDLRIVGIVGPRGDAYSSNNRISEQSSEDYHSWQVGILKDIGVDMVWGATFNNVDEGVGLARTCSKADIPLCLSYTLNSQHRLSTGPSLREAVETTDFRAKQHRPTCYGLNCSHPLEFAPALVDGDWILRLRNLRPNAAMMDKVSLCKLGHLEDGDPVELGQQMGELAATYPHIDIWGGCCGTCETHLSEIVKSIKDGRNSFH